MTKDQVLAAAKKYAERLYAYPPKRWTTSLKPSAHEAGCHIHWMCLEVRTLVADGRLDKANRWMGFIQGSLWTAGLGSIDEFKNDNR